KRGCDIKWNIVLMCSNRDHVRAYLVGNVSICRNAVRANYNAVDFSRFQEMSCHAIGDERDWNVLFHKLPGSKSCSLQERSGFIGEDAYVFARFNSSAYYAERCSKACRCQSTCIAMCEHGTVVRDKLGAESPHFLVAFYILAMNSQCF